MNPHSIEPLSKAQRQKQPKASQSSHSPKNGTKNRILDAGRAEFASHGYNGARIERIAKRARCNIRMIYHYYGRKNALYLTVLEESYRRLREMEEATDFRHLDPDTGMQRLVEFTFDYVQNNPTYVRLLMNENLLKGKFLQKSRAVPATTPSRVEAVEDLLARGQISGRFRENVDPVQLFVTVLAVCYVHASNCYTLSIMFQQNVADAGWLAARRRHVVEVILSYLRK